MKRLPILISIICFCCLSVSAQTYYYEKVAIVINNAKRSASGDGHFITFTPKACYDSDINGFSEDFGVLKYNGIVGNNFRSYSGESYFGNAEYIFSSDLSRINIHKSNGEILVYARKNPPAGVKKSSRVRLEPADVPIFIPTPNLDNDSATESVDHTKRTESVTKYGYYTCPTCHGSKKCIICGGKGYWRNSYEGFREYQCNNCPNSSGRCPSCDGTGKKYGIIR